MSLELIKKIPTIIDAHEVHLTKEILGLMHPRIREVALKNSKSIKAFKIAYKSQGHKVIGFIVEPKKKSGKLPCIVYNRGGSRDFGALNIGQLFYDLAEFATKGYLVIASQYSGNSGSEGIDEMGGKDIYDVLNLYKILEKYPTADTSRIGMYGHSRGGMMTYLALAKVRWIKAAVVGAAKADEVNAAKYRKGWAEHQKEMYGGSLIERKKRTALLWTHKFSKKVPILLMHGTADWRVSPLDSIRMSQKLYENKIPHRLVMFEGADHGLNEFRKESQQMTFDWFDKYLIKKSPLPDLKPHGR